MEYLKQVQGWAKRRTKIVKLRAEGKTFDEIGNLFCISRQRAQQLWKLEVERIEAEIGK